MGRAGRASGKSVSCCGLVIPDFIVVHKENMALYQKELILKQQHRSIDFFITGKDFEAPEAARRPRRSQYAESVLKYPSCESAQVRPSDDYL